MSSQGEVRILQENEITKLDMKKYIYGGKEKDYKNKTLNYQIYNNQTFITSNDNSQQPNHYFPNFYGNIIEIVQ
jgi:hypothetical protein